MVMKRWNTHNQVLSCCPFHTQVKDLRMVAGRLHKRRCLPNHTPVKSGRQCNFCGTLAAEDDESDTCDICEGCVENIGGEQIEDVDRDDSSSGNGMPNQIS